MSKETLYSPIPEEELPFYRGIWAAPYDDAPRLIFADWLDEHGKEEVAFLLRLDVQQRRSTNGKERWQTAMDVLRKRLRHNKKFLDIPILPLGDAKEYFQLWNNTTHKTKEFWEWYEDNEDLCTKKELEDLDLPAPSPPDLDGGVTGDGV